MKISAAGERGWGCILNPTASHNPSHPSPNPKFILTVFQHSVECWNIKLRVAEEMIRPNRTIDKVASAYTKLAMVNCPQFRRGI